MNLATPEDTFMGSEVLAEILKERLRQMSVEGWSTAHDDGHRRGELAAAAACYAAPERVFFAQTSIESRGPYTFYVDAWPWDGRWWKPKDRIRDLVRAGALIVAEIERLKRLQR